MINFKQKEEILPSALIVLAIAILAVALIYTLIVPPPAVSGSPAAHSLSRRTMQNDTKNATADIQQANAAIKPLLWTGKPEQVTAAVLAQLTQLCGQHGLQMTSFRPQKPQILTGVTEMQYTLQLTGPYAAIEAVLTVLDAHGTKLALRSIQISPSQGASSVITSTIALSAYLQGTDGGSPDQTPEGGDSGQS